ncbi:unnamed protein product [Lasius platythorax]|uniref:Uncharacterized protein n=1 Tax=Lasius platythorax TaxID=488582 RepID=A0AAV2MVX1_9HYME
MEEVLLPNEDEQRQLLPENLQLIKKMDAIWMLSHALKIPNTPMWVGFNSRIIEDINVSKQTICYLTPINVSPTNVSVVIKTMKQSQQIANELNQPSIDVT